ncbi:J domain-containing protein [Aquibium microcysteis]|uniref:J domain-containing protein n=1 Tax=Aquibium microcysteis TaxID=675281 RepID=UPI00165D19B2|nr:J domain-containing protein [Aquibium microcysteis]
MAPTAYPLAWPPMMPRTKSKQTSRFKTNLPAALKNVRSSLANFGSDSAKPISQLVISSNVTLGSERPSDTGVAVWFVWDSLSVCIAVDRYPKVEDNLQAIHHVLEARRTELRHGGLNIVRATFTGFAALPAPAGKRPWREVLEMPDEKVTADAITARYRRLATLRHPDQPRGSDAAMAELNRARDEAMAEVKGNA